ncbi:uncharacterized protein [Aegilops tauschii subsp. strangulata]|uniref:uncharacterized protein n=1 Tax=Aegilops tauschii subsp. strangulata TaxID=200361 RepID=UPI003CC85AF8
MSNHAPGNLDSCKDDSWKRIWKLPCPRNVQMFTWRVKHESLALLTNMHKRGLKVESTRCLFCGRADEDGAHLFIKCKAVKEGWRELALEGERIKLEQIPSVHAMLDFLWGVDEKKRMHILTYWWHWWSVRNKLRKGEPVAPAKEIARRTRSAVMEYMQVYINSPKKACLDKWTAPSDEMLKINADGSFAPGEGHAGWGVVARDSAGNIVAARAGRQDHIQDAFAAKVAALSNAVALAADLGCLRVNFETDSQLLVEAMDFRKPDSSAAAVIEDTKFQLKMWFSKHTISVCRRSANAVGHELANTGRLYPVEHVMHWESDVPAHVAACASSDMPEHR